MGCSKTDYNVQSKLLSRSAFPTSISMGSDTTYFRVDSICLCNATAYLNTCGTSPSTEAPTMGTEVYQIAGASQSVITGNTARVNITNLTYGKYTFVGHAFVIGYRSCDSQTMNDNAYDTINVTILKNKKRLK